MKHKESLGKKRLQCRVYDIIRHGKPGEIPVDFVKKVFLKQMYDLGKSLARAAPPGFRIYNDLNHRRWMVNLGNSNTQSRSWSKYGHIESGVLILAKAWEGYMELYGLPTCPIEGLMELAKAIQSNYPTSSSALGRAISAYAVSEAAASSVSSEASSASASDAAVSVA